MIIVVTVLACPLGTFERLDESGNPVCVGSETGQIREIHGTLRDCPTGYVPMLTAGGSACVNPRAGMSAYDVQRNGCPNGTARALTTEGDVCR